MIADPWKNVPVQANTGTGEAVPVFASSSKLLSDYY